MRDFVAMLARMSYKKIVTAAAIGAVALCVIAAGIFMAREESAEESSKAMQEKTADSMASSEKAEDKAAVSDAEEGNAAGWKEAKEHYLPFISQIEAALADNFQSVSIMKLGISSEFKDGIEKPLGTLGYAITDLDADGTYELVFGRGDYYIFDIYTLSDGEMQHVATGDQCNYYYLCSGGALANVAANGSGYNDDIAFYAYEDGRLNLIEAVMYDESINRNRPWYYNDKEVSIDNARSISQAKAWEIRDNYEYTVMDFTQFTDSGQEEEPRPINYADHDNLTFSDLAGMQFWIGTGAAGGGWRSNTVLTIEADGTFEGYYQDRNEYPGYINPKGTMNECHFYGKFSQLTKSGAFEYQMNCEYLTVQGTVGEERLEDGLLITTTLPYNYMEPYTFQEAGEVRLYLPGKARAELPEAYQVTSSAMFDANDVLTGYMLYNVGDSRGFTVLSDAEIDRDSLFTDTEQTSWPPADVLPEKEIDAIRKEKGYKDEFSLADLKGMGFTDDEYVEIKFGADGTFEGHFSENKGWDEDELYGIVAECQYYGQVASVTKTGSYEYTVKIESLQTETLESPNGKNIVDGKRMIAAPPYGVYNTEELVVYVPGKRIHELPEPFLEQEQRQKLEIADDRTKGVIDRCIIYNPGEEKGFVRAVRLGISQSSP